MSHDNNDDRHLASEVEDALRALGIVGQEKDPRVAPFVRELRCWNSHRSSGESGAGEGDRTA
ncbi:MAG TPA: hypothetical protein VGO17_08435 [Aurantimonas sp.]|nr:hypothetical protein [Aurantimonas sp.]